MFQFQLDLLSDRRGLHLRILSGDAPLTFQEVAQRWPTDPGFCEQFNQVLADAPYKAFRWELPGLTKANWKQPFECVVVDSQELQRPASPLDFQEHFSGAQQVVTFANLRGDATLVVPSPVVEADAYPHLAAFVRRAPAEQQRCLWQTVGEAWQKRMGDKPVWLSTAGAGVPWLHVRLDDRPKYYSYGPYRKVVAVPLG